MDKLDLLKKKTESDTFVPSQPNEEKKPDHSKPARTFHPWRRVIVVFVLSLVAFAGVLGYKAYSVGTQIIQPDEKLSFFEQLQSLVRPPDRPLNGEDEGRINILLLGFGGEGHQGAYLTDTIIVASLKPDTKEVAMLSLPRDLFVDIPGYGYRKINNAFAFGVSKNDETGGEALAQSTVQNLLNIPIHYYTWIDFSGFEEIIDDIGGIEVDVETAFVDYSYPTDDYGYQTISFSKGLQTMDGETALKYVRSRKGTNGEGSDFARSKRQQKVLLAVKDKLTGFGTLANPSKVSKVLDDLGGHMETNMQIWEILKMAKLFEGLDTSSLYTRVLDNSQNGLLVSDYTQDGAYILRPKLGWDDYSAVSYLAEHIFALEKLEAEQATLAVFNGTRETGLAQDTADALESKNYTVNKIGTASAYASTTIYDFTNGTKPLTREAITDEFGNNVVTTIPDAVRSLLGSTPTDFIIILGEDMLREGITGGPVT